MDQNETLTKQQIQERISKNGSTLDLDKFSWDENTRTLVSEEDTLTMNFIGIDDLTITAKDFCTITTGNNSKIVSGSRSSIRTGLNAKLDVGHQSVVHVGEKSNVLAKDHCIIKGDCRSTFHLGSYALVRAESNNAIYVGNYSTIVAQDNNIVLGEDKHSVQYKRDTLYSSISLRNNGVIYSPTANSFIRAKDNVTLLLPTFYRDDKPFNIILNNNQQEVKNRSYPFCIKIEDTGDEDHPQFIVERPLLNGYLVIGTDIVLYQEVPYPTHSIYHIQTIDKYLSGSLESTSIKVETNISSDMLESEFKKALNL